MKTKRITSRIVSIKWLLSMTTACLVLIACQKEDSQEESTELDGVVNLKGKKSKVDICHYDADSGLWKILQVNGNAWRAHQNHGDVRLDDRDGDGFVPDNACGYGQMGDCDDKDPNVNPDVLGSCGDAIDSDGDGIADGEDDCPTEAGLASLNGCPDADGDGIADKDNECPNEAGPADNDGCPSLELSDYEVLRLLYESNPDNALDWDLSNESMDNWQGVSLTSEGNVFLLFISPNERVTNLPSEIGLLEELNALIIACCLENIPSEIGDLKNLVTLVIANSTVQVMPQEISNLTKLETLALLQNFQLTELPVGLDNLKNLKILNLEFNNLSSIPTELGMLNELTLLDITNNPVTIIPRAVCDLADADTEVILDSDDVCQ